MKSSITTRSVVPPALTSVLVAFRAASPLVIRTRATIGESNTAPTKLNPWAPSRAVAGTLAISTPFASKYSTRAEPPARSTSENTTPKPLTRPLVVVPASLKSTSTRFEPTAMNSFLGENALNWSASPALIDANAVPVDLTPAARGGRGVRRIQVAAQRSAKPVQGIRERRAIALRTDDSEGGSRRLVVDGRRETVARRQSHQAQERCIDGRFHRVLRRD